MSIVLVGSTSGSITLQEPAVAGTTVLNLPAVSGTILTTGSSGQSIPSAALPVGSVLQVVNAKYDTQVSSTTTNYADTGLTATITPKFSSSTILVLVNQAGVGKSGDTRVKVALLRSGSNIATLDFNGGYTGNSNTNRVGSVSSCYLDSPATTSATTYKTQFGLFDGTGTVTVQTDGCVSTITLLEIAA
jgi:hypothetical protein